MSYHNCTSCKGELVLDEYGSYECNRCGERWGSDQIKEVKE